MGENISIMNIDDYYNLGAVSKVFSFKGEVVIYLDVDNPYDYEGLDTIFIDINGNYVPYLIERIKIQNKGFARVKLKGVDTEEQSRMLIRKKVYLPTDMLPQLDGDDYYFHELIGFGIISDNQNIGEVRNLLTDTSNPLIEALVEGKEVLIPFHDDIVIKVDKKSKTITVNLPDGLLDL